MIRAVAFVALPLAVFVASVAITLGAQGKLSRESLARLPGLGALAPQAAEPAGEGRAEEQDEGGELGHPAGDELGAAFDLPRPFEAEELERMVAELERHRDSYQSKAGEVERQRLLLTRLGDELEERRTELEEIMASLAEQQARIQADRIEQEARRLRVSVSEAESLRPLAKTYEAMQPAAAAERLERLDLETVTKVLALMRSRRTAKILEAIDPALAAELTKRLGALHGPEAKAEPE